MIDDPTPGRAGAPMKQHGKTCRKVPHETDGYLHSPEDDGPYDVDGVTYCGRCHEWLDAGLETPAVGRAGAQPADLGEKRSLFEGGVTWYGPHQCATCGGTIIKAAQEAGGEQFDVPERLLRIFQRGAESHDPYVAYPMTWRPHVHVVDTRPAAPPAAVPSKEPT